MQTLGMKWRWMAGFLLAILALRGSASGNVTLPKVIGDAMVLQRQRPVPIWGHASPGESVTVTFAGQSKTATADSGGSWNVSLDAMEASSDGRAMTIAGKNTITLQDILVGEVWICSGQSNMDYPMGRGPNYHPPKSGPDYVASDLATANEPLIRLFKVDKVYSLPDVTSVGWKSCNTTSLKSFSAVGYFFGKDLLKELKVPIGLIHTAWGGTRIEPFTPPEAYASIAALGAGGPIAQLQIDGVHPGKVYQSLIKPLSPFGIRGAIWYQRESNIIDVNDSGPHYADKMQALVESWRAAWKQGDFPFYFVQIAPFYYTARKSDAVKHTADNLPQLWEGQTLSLRIPNTAMVATIDITEDPSDIHPPDKWDVGARLANVALGRTYHRDVGIDSGPMFDRMTLSGSSAVVTFSHVGTGLVSRDGRPLSGFTVAGIDGRFVAATATISGDTVIVGSAEVPVPAAVRYAWAERPLVNLTNTEGLPAFPFRTDAPLAKVAATTRPS
jgi:sialate O-acetylesterase